MADGSIVFKTDLDNADLEKQLSNTEKRIEQLKKQIEGQEVEKSFAEKQMERLGQEIEQAKQRAEQLQAELSSMGSMDAMDTQQLQRATELMRQMNEQYAKVDQNRQKIEKLEETWGKASDKISAYTENLQRTQQRQTALAAEYARSYKSIGTNITGAMAKAREAISSFGARLGSIVKQTLVFGVVYRVFGMLRDGIAQVAMENMQFSASWTVLTSAIHGFASGIAAVVLPAISSMVKVATAMITTLARIVDRIFNTQIVAAIQKSQAAAQASWRETEASKEARKLQEQQSKKQQQDAERRAKAEEQYAKRVEDANARLAKAQQKADERLAKAQQSADKYNSKAQASYDKKIAKAEEKREKAAKKLEKAQKKANQQIFAFDELNKMTEDSTEDAIEAIEDYTDEIESPEFKMVDPDDFAIDPDDYLQEAFDWDDVDWEDFWPEELMNPDWSALDVGKIDAKLAEIMIVLGAALMAVGAVLAFSGINIPLGLTLMAIGALMIYTAYQEAWDKLPAQTQDAITNALAITGIVLFVVGAVLAFSGINIPLGIGLMAAGAVVFGVAVALNWESMPVEMQNIITRIGAIIGGALLVIGAVLAFSGINIPLGIGLVAVGALTLGIVAALNWDAIKDKLEEILPALAIAIGAAALVIGTILAFSGVNIPLGIALMAAGAVTLAVVAHLNWDSLPESVKGVIATLEYALGVALLAVGAILAFSGAAIPLGIALMALGAVALGHASTLNWDNIPEEIKSKIAIIEAALGVALLTIGAVLAFSAVNIPLGIALMALGAVALAHVATLDWNAMPEKVKSVVTQILGIVGTALIVIGIILVATGVALPLGVALIAAGAVSLIAAAAINWDFIVDKIKEIWGKIKEFWRTNIAPIFTWEWWANLFKSMVNGLIRQINNGLDAFGGFLNSLAEGVSNILNFFGVEGWSFSIGMPHIPYLAQGAVIPPNREFMAVLGDQRSGTNIETPEALMRQVVREETGPLIADMVTALINANFGGGAEQRGDVVLMVGRRELARETLRGVRELQDTGELGTSGLIFA